MEDYSMLSHTELGGHMYEVSYRKLSLLKIIFILITHF